MNTPGQITGIQYRELWYSYLSGAFFMLLAVLILIASSDELSKHYFHPSWLSSVHLLLVGGVTNIIYGAGARIIPVVLEAEKSAFYSILPALIMNSFGAVLLGFSFYKFQFSWWTYLAPLFIFGAVIYYLYCAKEVFRKSKSVFTLFSVQSSVAYLILTCFTGALLLVNFRWPLLSVSHLEVLPSHASLGLIGWIFLLFLAVGSRLIPMFLISEITLLMKRLLKFSLGLFHAGLLISVVYYWLFTDYPLLEILSGILLVAGLFLFLSYCLLAFKGRLRKKLDIPLQQTRLSLFFFAVSLFLFAFPDDHINRYVAGGFCLIFGGILSLVMAQGLKTLPFLRWALLKSEHGLSLAMQPADLSRPHNHRWMSIIHFLAIATAITGILLSSSFLWKLALFLLLVSLFIFISELSRMHNLKVKLHDK